MFENVGPNVFRRPEGISSVVQPPKHLHQSRAIVGSTVDYRRAYMDIEGGGRWGITLTLSWHVLKMTNTLS